jgi:pyruvate dehydrogenase (quinone)
VKEGSVLSTIAADALIERLADWGVDTVFGIPGDGINGIMEGLRRHQDRVKFVLVHHEEAAAFMATGYAKATGRLGVCLATSGPGGIHLLNGLYDAKLDHMPVLAITGMQETSVLGTGYQQEVNLDKLYQDVAEYDQMIYNPAQLPSVVDNAIRTAYARRGVAHLTVPNDLQVADADADPWQHVAPARSPNTSPVMLPAPARPDDADLQRIADLLAGGEKIALLVGAGALHARAEVLEVAEILGAPIVKTLSGKAVVPDDSSYTTGGIGLLGTRPTADLMDEIDTLFMIGTNFPYTKHLPEPGKVRVAQIEVDPIRAGARVATEVPVVGDAQVALRALMPMLVRRSDTSFLDKCRKSMDSWREQMAAQQDEARDPIAPQYVVGVLDELAADDAILTCDSGTIATWAARHWTIRADRRFYLSGNLASMAPGLPYAIGIQHALPGRQVIGYVGDGGFSMLMAEFLTAVQHQLPVKIVINNNNSLGQILWEQMVLGYPEHGVRYPRPYVDYAAFAAANGGLGIKVEKPSEVRPAIAEALSYPGPALVDVNVNPDEPPLPGKVEYQQAKKFAEAFLKGQPRRATIATTLFRDKIEQLKA